MPCRRARRPLPGQQRPRLPTLPAPAREAVEVVEARRSGSTALARSRARCASAATSLTETPVAAAAATASSPPSTKAKNTSSGVALCAGASPSRGAPFRAKRGYRGRPPASSLFRPRGRRARLRGAARFMLKLAGATSIPTTGCLEKGVAATLLERPGGGAHWPPGAVLPCWRSTRSTPPSPRWGSSMATSRWGSLCPPVFSFSLRKAPARRTGRGRGCARARARPGPTPA